MISDKLTLIPGPTPVHARILDALARPTLSHQDPDFVVLFRRVLADLRSLVRTERAQPFVVSGAGTLAMEMALVNLVAPGERLLVVSHGYFGDRWVELAEAFGIGSETLAADWGRAVSADELSERVESGRFAAIAATHVDTSTGTMAPVADYAARLRGRDELFIVDGVCATGGVDERFDEWGIDVLLTGAQKALGVPPGLALLAVSERALARRRSRPGVDAYYADLLRWLPIMEEPSRYFSTPAVNEVTALGAGLELALEEGLETRFERHRRLAKAIRAGMAALGLAPVTDERWLAPTLSVVGHPPGVDDARLRREMAARGVVVAGCLGAFAGRGFRVGHMGNIDAGDACRFLEALEESLAACGHEVRSGSSIEAAARHFRA